MATCVGTGTSTGTDACDTCDDKGGMAARSRGRRLSCGIVAAELDLLLIEFTCTMYVMYDVIISNWFAYPQHDTMHRWYHTVLVTLRVVLVASMHTTSVASSIIILASSIRNSTEVGASK